MNEEVAYLLLIMVANLLDNDQFEEVIGEPLRDDSIMIEAVELAWDRVSSHEQDLLRIWKITS